MAETIVKKCNIEPTLIEGRGGIFDIRVDGELIYSKHDTGEFPEHDLVSQKIQLAVA